MPALRSSHFGTHGMSTQVQETLAECLAAAESDSPEDQLKALQIMVSLTKVSSANRNLLVQNSAAVDILLALSGTKSKSSTVYIQATAFSILFNLSLNPNLKSSLARTDVIHHLNSVVLSPTSPQSGKIAASLICSLAMLDRNKAKFGVAGTVQAIVRALGAGVGENPAAHHLLSSLAELIQFHGNCTLAARSGAVPTLVRILEGPHDDLAGSSLSILGLLSRFDEGMDAVRAVDGIVGLLVDGLKRTCMASRESAAEVLVRLFEESEECMREAAEKPEFSMSLVDLSIRGSAKARENADVLMRLMMEAIFDCNVDGESMVLI